jgi:protein-S-isoprenylcysteine O-methyltransferase Ste14
MISIIIFILLSIPIIVISWRSIFRIKNHGLYRFISWECILWLIISNIVFWFKDPFSIFQVISWVLLFLSLYPFISGVYIIKKAGQADRNRDNSLYGFEKTSELIETGVFKYIRHPLYTSLLLLTWGIFFKHTDYILLLISFISSAALFLTARMEEKENIRYFGEQYREYMRKTKMFIPFII